MFRAPLRAVLLAAAALVAALPGGATEIYEEGELIVTLAPGASIAEVNTTWGTLTLDSFPSARLYLLLAEDVGDLELFADSMAVTDPAVDEAEANYFEDTPEGIRQMVLVAVGGTITDFEDQSLTDRIGLDEAHTWARGEGTTVAVLDTGIDTSHPAFAGRIAPIGYDFVDDDPNPAEVANGQDDDGDGMTDEGYGHGTMVAGIVTLVAPEAKIVPIRVLDDEGRADAWRIVKAMAYAIDVRVDVLNMSFGVPRTISPIGHQIDAAVSMGIVCVAGAGNENNGDDVYYPGADSKAILVTALDSLDVKADFADYHSKVLVSAPGTGVRSAYPGGEWALGAGCSFATPFVSGEIALIRSRAPSMGVEAVEDRVEQAVDRIYGIPGNGPYEGKLGSGRIFLPEAVADLVTAVPEAGTLGGRLDIWPNPMSRTLRVSLDGLVDAAGGGHVLEVFGATGRRVRTLAVRDRGGVVWDGTDTRGRSLAAGVYYLRLRNDDGAVATAKVHKLR
jgi:subtilisin family serine protease